ncbi:MAG TPA: HAD family hydrolase [Planctomycetota bacterium]|nr:HAD family hydrolase [Planctomycetota bacterium]
MIPRAVLFDAGGTLVFIHGERVAEAAARRGVRVRPEAIEAADPGVRRALDRAPRGTDDRSRGDIYLRDLLRAVGAQGSVEEAVEELGREHARSNLWSRTPPEVAAALDRLRGTRMAVVSNSNGTVRELLRRVGLADRFELIIDSAEVGVEKPDPAIFRIALERMKLSAAEAVYVGDTYHFDVVGARAAGVEPVLLDPGGLYPDSDARRVRSLAELIEALRAPGL